MTDEYTRDEAIVEIRAALKRRSGKTWSVTGGRGTSWGWVTIQAPPARRGRYGETSAEDCAQLAVLLRLEHVHDQGVMVPAGLDYRREYVTHTNNKQPTII